MLRKEEVIQPDEVTFKHKMHQKDGILNHQNNLLNILKDSITLKRCESLISVTKNAI